MVGVVVMYNSDLRAACAGSHDFIVFGLFDHLISLIIAIHPDTECRLS